MQRIQGKVIIIRTKSRCRYFSVITLCLFIFAKMMKSPALNVSPLCRSVNDGVVTSRHLLAAAPGGKRDSRGDCFRDDLPKNLMRSRYDDSRGRQLGEGSNHFKTSVYFGRSGPHDALWYFTAPSHFHTPFGGQSFKVARSHYYTAAVYHKQPRGDDCGCGYCDRVGEETA